MKVARLFLILLCLAAATPLWAGVLLTIVDQPADQPNDQTTMKMYVDKDRLRVENSGQEKNNIVIYRADKNLFWMINSKDKTYMEITKADLEKLQQQMAEMNQRMEEAMKNMPPEQRQMMEQQMKGRMPAAKTDETTYKKVASGQKVGEWSATQYEGDREGQKVEDVWATSSKSLGLTAEDFNVLKDMSKFWEGMGRMGRSNAPGFHVNEEGEIEGKFSGVPVKSVKYAEGKVTSTSELKSVQREAFDASLFDLPAGLTKQEMPTGPRGRMHE